jgi:hypothetical protein
VVTKGVLILLGLVFELHHGDSHILGSLLGGWTLKRLVSPTSSPKGPKLSLGHHGDHGWGVVIPLSAVRPFGRRVLLRGPWTCMEVRT